MANSPHHCPRSAPSRRRAIQTDDGRTYGVDEFSEPDEFLFEPADRPQAAGGTRRVDYLDVRLEQRQRTRDVVLLGQRRPNTTLNTGGRLLKHLPTNRTDTVRGTGSRQGRTAEASFRGVGGVYGPPTIVK